MKNPIRRVTRTKSSPFFSASFFVGALMSGSPEPVAQKLGDIGALYGEMIQVNDDLNDVLEIPANADLAARALSLAHSLCHIGTPPRPSASF